MFYSHVPTVSFPSRFYALLLSSEPVITDTEHKCLLDYKMYDNENEFNQATAYSFVALVHGVYHFDAQISLAISGTTIIGELLVKLGMLPILNVTKQATGDNTIIIGGSLDVRLLAGQSIDLWCKHNAGSDQNLIFGGNATYLCGHRIA